MRNDPPGSANGGGALHFPLGTIMLVRHGKPMAVHDGWIAPRQLREWIGRYDEAVIADEHPPLEALSLAAAAAAILSSPRRRTVESARRLAPGRMLLTDELFREADLPHASWRFPKLPMRVWAAIFRVAWLCGYQRNSESLNAARARARTAAVALMQSAREGSVLLVGHGIMNALIGRQLRKLGAVGPRRPEAAYWRCAVYRMQKSTYQGPAWPDRCLSDTNPGQPPTPWRAAASDNKYMLLTSRGPVLTIIAAAAVIGVVSFGLRHRAAVPDAASRNAASSETESGLDRSGKARVGKASFYATRFAGRKMADGKNMNPQTDNAASKSLPLGTTAKVTNLDTGKSAVVIIQDRGPYVDGRIVDLSPATAHKIGLTSENGVARVAVAPIVVPEPDGSTKLGAAATDATLAGQLRSTAKDAGASAVTKRSAHSARLAENDQSRGRTGAVSW